MRIAILDCTGTIYTEEAASSIPLGGIERCIISLSRALYNKGAKIRVFNTTPVSSSYRGITWSHINAPTEFKADIVIACNDAHLFDTYAKSATHKNFKPFLWLHNPVTLAKTIRKGRIWPLLRWRPTGIFLGQTQKDQTSWLIPFGRRDIIGHGVESSVLEYQVNTTPPPPATAYISQSYRGLDHVINIWKSRIFPSLPRATLDIYCTWNGDTTDLEKHGITLKGRMPRSQLLSELSQKRAMFIPGHADETFCLAAAESLCLGIPIITYGTGALKERVVDKETGFIASGEQDFADSTLRLLTDDALWLELHTNAVKVRNGADWDTIADRWLTLL